MAKNPKIDPLEDPYGAYLEACKQTEFQKYTSSNSGWVWKDTIILNEFKELKEPEENITVKIANLKSFYMIYLGRQRNLKNLGGLFCQLFATCPGFSEDEKSTIFQFEQGERPIPTYTPDTSLTDTCRQFLEDDITKFYERNDMPAIAPQVEGWPRGLVDDEERVQPDMQDKINDEPNLDHEMFYLDLQTALKLLDESPNTETSKTSLNSLHRTAVFLILVMARRITKRDSDLDTVFQRGNIHRHYVDLVPERLGISLPPLPKALNQALEATFSLGSESGRIFCLLLLYAKATSTVSLSTSPVGMLNQGNLGIHTVLQATCMVHIAGAGLPLVTLFLAVKEIYNKTESQTIQWLSFDEMAHSLGRLVKLRLEHFKLEQRKEGTKLFPYCRLVHNNYHMDLSAKTNEQMCYFLACLVDLRSPPMHGTGGAKAAMWTASLNATMKSDLEEYASKFYAGTSGITMSARYGQYNSGAIRSKTGKVWAAPVIQEAHDHQQASEDDDEIDDFSAPIVY